MKGNRRLTAFIFATALLLSGFFAARVVAQKPSSTPGQEEFPAGEYDSAVWGKRYPLQYKSYLKSLEYGAVAHGLRGKQECSACPQGT